MPADQVHEATARHRDLSGPYPVPRGGWLSCPVCHSTTVQGQMWTRRVRPDATITHRVDVRHKCCACACCWVHGVAVPHDYGTRNAGHPNRHTDWRTVRAANDLHTEEMRNNA